MLIDTLRHHLGWLYRMRSIYLFASLLLFVLLTPLLGDLPSIQSRLIANLLNMFVLVAAVAAVGRSRRSFVIALLFTLPVLGLQLAGLLFADNDYLMLSWVFGGACYSMTLLYLLRYVFSDEAMSADKLFGAAAAYMLLGFLWVYLYMIAQHFHPGAFTLYGSVVTALPPQDMIYFSYTTLTTTGYGDIAPLHASVRALANLEQIGGTLFVAILIARLAGMYPERDKGNR
ncbi:MAG: voltage-gated potassium channel [Pseudomonadaceae bacterium]|jgi:hypothetical protein|nr:voltage-gated potassium channel [Pseudomonadaceae bacterium]